MDLYELLGVARSATSDEIHSAYRRLSKKHHPDTGGDRALYEQIKLADDVLTDAARRQKYDETGTFNQTVAGNPLMVQALQWLSGAMNDAINAMESRVYSDPDLIESMRKFMRDHKKKIKVGLTEAERAAGKFGKIRDRIAVKTGENHLARMLDRQIEAANARAAEANEALAIADLALSELERYIFAMDDEKLLKIPTAAESKFYEGHTF